MANNDLHHMNGHQIYSLTHEVIDEICGISRLQKQKYVPNLWSTDEQFYKFVDYFKNLLSNLIDIRNKHESLQQFSEDIQKVVMECIEVRRAQLRKAIINNTIEEKNPVLNDFFWKLNVVLDSDRMNDINQPLVNFDLNISQPMTATNTQKYVSLELNREELSQVLKTLEEAQQELRNSY